MHRSHNEANEIELKNIFTNKTIEVRNFMWVHDALVIKHATFLWEVDSSNIHTTKICSEENFDKSSTLRKNHVIQIIFVQYFRL